MTTNLKRIESIELTEATGLTVLREATTTWFSARTGIKVETPIMLRLGHLHKGTTSHKVTKGVEQDVVNKPFEINETTKDGKVIKVINLNQRLGLTMDRKPREHADRVERLVSALSDALIDITIPREPNKAGTLTRTAAANKALKLAGFVNWREPLIHGKRFAATISPKVTFATDAFEIPKADKSNEGRKAYKVEIRDEEGKVLCSLNCGKSFYEANRDKAAKLHMTLIEVDAVESAKANALHKAVKDEKDGEADEASKQAEEDTLTELLKSFE